MTTTPTESALLVPMPEADPVVGRWREQLDPGCRLGVPAHVTILYPFVPPEALDDRVMTEARDVVQHHAPFDCSLGAVRWFGEAVVYLAPAPDEPFRALTGSVFERFPAYPPYGGVYDDVVPHLTIGDHGALVDMHAAAHEIAPALPIACQVHEVWLMVGAQEPGWWRLAETLPLRG